jgi:hypothetical protein
LDFFFMGVMGSSPEVRDTARLVFVAGRSFMLDDELEELDDELTDLGELDDGG